VNVVDAFLVEVGGHKLLLPMQHIVETRLVKEAQIKTEAGRGTLRFYDQAVLLVNLEEAMKLGTPSRNPVFPVLFIRSHEETLALQVDAILGRRKILLKPLPDPLQTLAFISGVTIAENGMPAFVVSVADIFARLKHRAVQSLSQGEASLPASVLVIDDSLTTRTLINGILLDEGYRVSLAQSAEDAATMIEEQNFDLIITDVEMPGEDGFALTERIRSHPKHSETPVMIMSSRGSDADIRQGIAVGASAYIVKGQFEQKVFIETLESLI
jgi:two-component system chemotaxis sensor kinase CheA